jgi:chemotaxis protein methyltransferase WspC
MSLSKASAVGARPTLPESECDQLARRVSALSGATRFPEAIEICEQQLRQHGPSPQVYFLLGMVFQAAGSYDQAGSALERAVYLDPHHEDALLALALLARRRGDVQTAERFEQRSQRAHDRRRRT